MSTTFAFLFCSVFALTIPITSAQETVSIESLLSEMIDRDRVACFPVKNFRLKQSSSYNRSSKTPDEPVGWFTNQDFNKRRSDKNFIRVEEQNGKKEWVLMDHTGAGAIVRSWMPWHNQNNGGSDITMRIYLDGATEPTLEGNMLGMFDGTGVIPYPFAHPSLRSAVNFFPIPYAKSCQVTTTEMPFFYQFTFREYDEGASVKTFTMEDFEQAKDLTARTGEKLLNPTATSAGNPLRFSARIGSREEKSLDLPPGSAAVRELSVKLGSYADRNCTRQVVLKMEFDSKQTVWCPIGDFFGSGIGLNPFQGFFRTVTKDGTMSCRWVMPYRKNAKVSLINLSSKPVDAELEVKTGAWTWDDRSMYFHAGWRGQSPVPTRPHSDWNYVALKGRGVYVGDTLTVVNPVDKWWGEGDEKIWVDGESFPSIFGTGTEDYYGYSWGGRSTDFYEHPFHAQPFCHRYNKLKRKPKVLDERNTQGISVETRSRALDTMPFATSLQLDMEVWSWTDCDMGYGVGTYWYGFADTVSNHKPAPEEVLNVPPLPNMNADHDVSTLNNAAEIDAGRVISKSANLTLKPQNLRQLKLSGSWNNDDHLFFKNAQVGDSVEIRIPASSPVAEQLTLYATKAQDYGILNFRVNGKQAVTNIDLFHDAKATSYGPIVLGVFEPVDGAYVLRVEVAGKNPNSKGVLFGLDCVSVGSAESVE